MEKDDTEEIKAKMKALDEVMHSISQKLYMNKLRLKTKARLVRVQGRSLMKMWWMPIIKRKNKTADKKVV